MDERVVCMSLELRLRGDEVRGHLGADEGERLEFSGWLGLIAAIDALTAPPDPLLPHRG